MLEGSEGASAGFRRRRGPRSFSSCLRPRWRPYRLGLRQPPAHDGHELQAAVYGLWYYCANPAHTSWRSSPTGGHRRVLGLLKLVLVSWSLLRSAGRTRVLFAMLVAFELGQCRAAWIGRYHTGLFTTRPPATSTPPCWAVRRWSGFWFSSVCGRIPGPKSAGRAVAGIVPFFLSLAMLKDWDPRLNPSRPGGARSPGRFSFRNRTPSPMRFGIPGLPMERAKALMANLASLRAGGIDRLPEEP